MSNVGPSASVGRFAVLGPGGVGGLLAALLARNGSAVTCLAEASTAQAIATSGIRVESAKLRGSRPRSGCANQSMSVW
jgi:2-dehydropantoate 2-reductase